MVILLQVECGEPTDPVGEVIPREVSCIRCFHRRLSTDRATRSSAVLGGSDTNIVSQSSRSWLPGHDADDVSKARPYHRRGMVMCQAGRGYFGEGKAGSGRQEKLPRVAGSTVTLGCSKKRLSEKNTTCAGWRRYWSLGCDLNVLLPTPGRLSWLRPASIRHASAHKGSPAFRRRATGNEKQLPIGSLIILCKMIRLPIVWALKSVGHNTSVALRLRCFEPQQSPMCLWTRNSRVRRLRVWLEQGDTGRALKQVRTPFPELCVLWGWW